ncbi:MAG TPA: hypothetical protein VF230_02550 [Acidimicrobiales bacterium]
MPRRVTRLLAVAGIATAAWLGNAAPASAITHLCAYAYVAVNGTAIVDESECVVVPVFTTNECQDLDITREPLVYGFLAACLPQL